MTDHPEFSPGTRVFKITQPDKVGWVVGPPRIYGPVTFYPVGFSGGEPEYVDAENLAPFEGEGVEARLAQGIYGNHASFCRIVTYTKLSFPLSDTLYAFLASRTDLYPYQYKPLVKFLESTNKRLLIADEVGLGKTIEAGLILIEQRMREDLQRVLVVCPASLRSKWREEMARRFDEHFTILDKKGLKELLARVEERGGAESFRAIVSYGPVRAPDVIELLQAQPLPLDLLIADEAHHFRNPETLTNDGVTALSEGAEAVLLLTATPIHLGSKNLLTLLKVLDPEEFDQLDVFDRRLEANRHVIQAERLLLQTTPQLRDVAATLRQVEATSEAARFINSPTYQEFLRRCAEDGELTYRTIVELQSLLSDLNVLSHVLSRSRKRDVQPDRPERTPWIQPVVFTPLEMEVYNTATADARGAWASAGAGSVHTFRAVTRQRQIASCLPAALRRLRLLAADAGLTYTEELSDLEEEEWESTSAPEEQTLPGIARYFDRITELEAHDSKFTSLLTVLKALDEQEPGRKIILFSYFKDTLSYLQRRLSAAGYSTALLTGDVPSRPNNPAEDERAKVIRRFRTDETIRILLSSEVGSEGLDFQFCQILINYDLPWNPMVVEQRIGRLDRLGQRAQKIIIVSLSVHDTIEDRILERLYQRIGIFEESIGDLEAILGEAVATLRKELLSSDLSPAEAEALIEKKAIAIERERQQTAQLEERSAELLGHDELFRHQLRRKEELRQYVVADELVVFVDRFLRERFPDSRLSYEQEVGIGRLTVSDSLLAFIRRHTAQGDPTLHAFTARSFYGDCPVTFEAERAAREPDLEYLGPHHPLVRSVVAAYREDPAVLVPTAAFGVRTAALRPGEYFYALDRILVTGVRSREYLEPMLVSLEDDSIMPEEAARAVVAAMVEDGYDVPRETVTATSERIMQARGRALEELASRIAERKAILARTNNQLADNRIASLNASHEAKRRKKTELLTKGRERGREPRYIRMLEGTIRNMDAAHQRRVEDVNTARKFDVSYRPVAAGILVVAP